MTDSTHGEDTVGGHSVHQNRVGLRGLCGSLCKKPSLNFWDQKLTFRRPRWDGRTERNGKTSGCSRSRVFHPQVQIPPRAAPQVQVPRILQQVQGTSGLAPSMAWPLNSAGSDTALEDGSQLAASHSPRWPGHPLQLHNLPLLSVHHPHCWGIHWAMPRSHRPFLARCILPRQSSGIS